MGYIKSQEEIAQIENALARPVYRNSQRLAIEFLIEKKSLARILPPPLQPTDTPLVVASVGRWQSNVVGDFSGAAIHVAASHHGVLGMYVLAIYMNREHPIIYGRDVVGEPKKWAHAELFKGGSLVSGLAERNGRPLFSLNAEMSGESGIGPAQSFTYNFKSRTSASGYGLEEDAILTKTTWKNDFRVFEIGEGEVKLVGGPHDPLEELQPIEIIRAIYSEYDTSGTCEAVNKIESKTFLPFHYGRMDSWNLLDSNSHMSPHEELTS